jgi:RNA polymerase sigma-70 factor (ECF subfamily)
MESFDPTNTSVLLRRIGSGDLAARDELFAAVYEDLRGIARAQRNGGFRGRTLQPTALVNEMWVRLAASPELRVETKAHFLNIASSVMRRILIDHARRRTAQKRRAPGEREVLDDLLVAWQDKQGVDVLALDAALDLLRQNDERLASVVELRFFGGLTEEEIAATLALTRRQVQHAWKLARAFLARELERAQNRGVD